eukprot:scaffold13597_cov83-Attheya_sp.AAC.1
MIELLLEKRTTFCHPIDAAIDMCQEEAGVFVPLSGSHTNIYNFVTYQIVVDSRWKQHVPPRIF